MDGQKFDELAKVVATATSRRKFLKGLAAAVGAALGLGGTEAALGAPGDSNCANQGQSCTAQKCCQGLDCVLDGTSGTDKFCCPTGTKSCDGVCLDLSNDVNNCGGCGVVCPGSTDPCRVAACVNGQCTFADVANGTPCEDGNLCTVGDTCQNGTCKPGKLTVCDQCFKCEPTTGLCEVDQNQVGQPCNDNNKCTENDKCTAAGTCVGTPVNCDDNNECTADTCDPETGCVHTPLTGTPCDTGNKCTEDVCNNGKCEQGPVVITCPQCQVCDPATGTCVNLENGTPCEDGDVCTLGDTCQNGTCKPGPVKVCDQCQVCADVEGVATCVPDENKVGQPCNDNNKCTENDKCTAAGTCVGTPVNCDDNNECTTDTCDPEKGCIHTPLTGTPCDTGNKCTTDVCENGVCKQGPLAVTCPQCQVCDPTTGTCKADPLQNDLPCEDGDLCTIGDTCQNGTCKPGAAKVCGQCLKCDKGECVADPSKDGTGCNDNNPCTKDDKCQSGVCVGTKVKDGTACGKDPITGKELKCCNGVCCPAGTKCEKGVCTKD